MKIWKHLEQHISQSIGKTFTIDKQETVGGGCINSAYKISNAKQSFFVKTNHAHLLSMFEAEAEGLQEIINSQSIAAPQVICCGKHGDQAYLVLEYFSRGNNSSAGQQNLGEKLACMHDYQKDLFGWHRDNTIGSTPQINRQNSHWPSFWRECRLAYQLELAANKGYTGYLQEGGKQLLENLHLFFTNYQPRPSLLHGDLWSGNYAVSAMGQGIIFDPAVYFGDAEADLAMTELFGGFSSTFYAAYYHHHSADGGYNIRKNLYNLYHIINHLNLFGGGYLSQGEQMIQSLLAQL